MKNIVIKIEGGTGSGKGVFSQIIQKALVELKSELLEVCSLTEAESDKENSISVMWQTKKQTFRNLAGHDVAGSQADYNEGFIKGCNIYAINTPEKAFDIISKRLNGEIDHSYKYGLNDSSRFFAAQNK